MIKKSFLSLLLIISMVYSGTSQGELISVKSLRDIRSPLYSIVTKKDNENWTFSFCKINKQPIECEYIGNSDGYSEVELNSLAHDELIEARWKTGAAIGTSLVLLAGGGALGFVGTLPFINYGSATTVSIVLYSAIGLPLVVATAPTWFKKTNPWHQFAQANVLGEAGILTEENIQKSNKEVLKVKELLSEILK